MAEPSTFHKFNHWRHRLMDISMIGLAIGAFAASGGTTAFFDPILAWMKMHFAGIPPLLASGPDFLSSAFHQAGQGVLFTGAEVDMAHAAHGAASAVVPPAAALPVAPPVVVPPVPIDPHAAHMALNMK